jgi:SAM-dependent methyltransferase
MLGNSIPQEYDQTVKNVFECLVAQNVPDHEKAGYSESHFAARARELRQDVDDLRKLLANREGQSTRLKALDVGCNNGALTNIVLSPDMDRYGVDSVPGLVEQAAKQYPAMKFSVGTCYGLPFSEQSFDMVVSFGLLQILPDPERFLRELVRVTKPGGIGLIEFYPGFSLFDFAARLPIYLARGKWSDAVQSTKEHFFGTMWRGVPLLKYRHGEVIAALRRCGVSRTINLSRRCFFFNSHRGVIAFVR